MSWGNPGTSAAVLNPRRGESLAAGSRDMAAALRCFRCAFSRLGCVSVLSMCFEMGIGDKPDVKHVYAGACCHLTVVYLLNGVHDVVEPQSAHRVSG